MDDMYSAEAVVEQLRRYGFTLFVGEDGVVHGRPRHKGMKITLEMRAVIDRLQAVNDQAAEILRSEPERLELTGISVEDARGWGEKVKAGRWKLEGQVVYHKDTNLCDLTVVKVVS